MTTYFFKMFFYSISIINKKKKHWRKGMKIGKQTEVLYANKGTKRRRKGQKKEGRTHRRPPQII